MIVDCHAHCFLYPDHWDREVMLQSQPEFKKSWPDEKFKAGTWNNPIEPYLAAMEGIVDKGIIQGVKARTAVGLDVDNDYLAAVAREHPDKLAWTCCVDPTEEGAAEEVERCVRELNAVGVGELIPGFGLYRLDDPRCAAVWAKAQELEVPVIIHATADTSSRLMRVNYANVMMIDDIAIDFPDLKIVIPHLGWPQSYRDTILMLQKHPNVYADICYLVKAAAIDRTHINKYLPVVTNPYFHWVEPLAYYFAETWGFIQDKLLFGTDWVATSPKACVDALNNLNNLFRQFGFPEVPEVAIQNILHENWKKVFKF